MHHIYHTEGIILEGRNYREADKCFFVFTRDLGLVFASAQGVRKLSSKLRYVLSDYSYIKLDLVRGRDMWRLTQASKMSQLENITKDSRKLEVIANISKLLKRLLAGEETDSKLFGILIEGLNFLDKENNAENIKNIEIILVLRVLHTLGYMGGGEEIKEAIHSPFSEVIYAFSPKRKDLLLEINKILRSTQM